MIKDCVVQTRKGVQCPTSDGVMIATGGEFEEEERTQFSIEPRPSEAAPEIM